MSFSFNWHGDEFVERAKDANTGAIEKVCAEALKDANALCKYQSHKLIESSFTASDFAKGELTWSTEYARRQYFTGTPHTNKNPSASLMWAHKAANANFKKYQAIFANAVREGM